MIPMAREQRVLRRNDLKQLCINNFWYNRGTNEEYAALLDKAENLTNVSTADILEIAYNILSHSKTEHTLEAICFEVARACISYFYLSKEEVG